MCQLEIWDKFHFMIQTQYIIRYLIWDSPLVCGGEIQIALKSPTFYSLPQFATDKVIKSSLVSQMSRVKLFPIAGYFLIIRKRSIGGQGPFNHFTNVERTTRQLNSTRGIS